jgi:pimeloyl-ACP methyl ester carboxylesterase
VPTVDIPQGRINYRVAGPEDAQGAPVVFVHGLIVDGQLWSGVAAALAEQGVRSYAPDLPLGSHRIALGDAADQSPQGVARLINDFLDALDLTDVTLVGNDTGGALCQFVIDADDSRIGRLVLTNCDAFDKFPPAPFGLLVKVGRSPRRLAFTIKPMRSTRLRHSVLGFGGLVTKPLDPELTARWTEPLLTDTAVVNDTARFLGRISKRDLLDVSTRLDRFHKSVRIVWGQADRFFKPEFGRRLAAAFPNATLVEIPGGRTFLPLDEPRRVADEIRKLSSDRT